MAAAGRQAAAAVAAALLFRLLLLRLAPRAAAVSDADIELLLLFKGNFSNGNKALYSWVPENKPCTSPPWQGVLCPTFGPDANVSRM